MSLYAKYQDIDEDEELEETEETSWIPILSVASKWFIRIGVVIGIILLIYYIVVGKVFSAFIFVIGLIVAYFFGYFFMFCLDKLTSMND